MNLRGRRCLPCEGGVPKLLKREIEAMKKEVPGWEVREERLYRSFELRDFLQAMAFINQMAELAEEEGHHPDFRLHDYRKVEVVLWTHALGGLSENDFILAAKIEALPAARG
jgi:4a-hydroxytetrahydrobiopterin dehydratase